MTETEKKRVQLLVDICARLFLVAETAENYHYEMNHLPHKDEYSNMYKFFIHLFGEVVEFAEKELTEKEYEEFKILTEVPNRYVFE